MYITNEKNISTNRETNAKKTTSGIFSESCWEMTMMAHTKPQERKKEESERLRGGGDQIKFIALKEGKL